MPRFPRHLAVCATLLLLAACSSVRVVEDRPGPDRPIGDQPGQVRSDRANTMDFPPGEDGYRPPARLAVLLPMSGNLASAGQSVRDGFLAAYYAETRQRPVVKFYDSQGTGAGAQAALSKAIADGAQMIVGPLTREEVNAAQGQAGNLPVIALNRASGAAARGSASFALLPEDEGAEAARRLADRGLVRVLVIAARGDSSQRAVAAFRAAFTERGGTVVGEIPISGEIPDLSSQFGAYGGVGPAQGVFLALDAAQARTIAAQLKVSPIAAAARVSTAQILNGLGSKTDVELDGIEYPELPWVLGQGVGLPEASGLSRSLPAARGGGQRLFAFGADAWRLAAYFERLYNDPSASVHGATGELQISIAGPVTRSTSWAVFSGGRGRPAPVVAPRARDDGGRH